ncbi:MAG: hypothetical protein OEV81_12920 [Betaproteobacteria bacterium]|nr:hypothetical protein [Betaproteobacteria bacterium]MDH5221986.1 hypothetical protein [Betaproteobacteria bacterium]MDH5349752.1 hypothetical protein [Betaproteobacteria bacterium]
MELNNMRCKECKGVMSLATLAPMEGEQQGVRMRIEGMPAMQCAEGHKRFVAPEFAVRMMEALMADKTLVPLQGAALKGLLRKRSCCPGCGDELATAPQGRVQARREVRLKGLAAFGVSVALPTFRCAACGKESVAPQGEVLDGLMKASIQAFRSAAVAPT